MGVNPVCIRAGIVAKELRLPQNFPGATRRDFTRNSEKDPKFPGTYLLSRKHFNNVYNMYDIPQRVSRMILGRRAPVRSPDHATNQGLVSNKVHSVCTRQRCAARGRAGAAAEEREEGASERAARRGGVPRPSRGVLDSRAVLEQLEVAVRVAVHDEVGLCSNTCGYRHGYSPRAAPLLHRAAACHTSRAAIGATGL